MRIKEGIIETSKQIKIGIEEARRMWQVVSLLHRGGQFRHGLVEDVNGNKWSIDRYENDILTAEKFKSICEEKGITWNDLVRIRVIKPKKFLGFFRQLTGITIEGAFNGCSACVEIMTDDDNGVSMMHYIDYEDIIGVELIKN